MRVIRCSICICLLCTSDSLKGILGPFDVWDKLAVFVVCPYRRWGNYFSAFSCFFEKHIVHWTRLWVSASNGGWGPSLRANQYQIFSFQKHWTENSEEKSFKKTTNVLTGADITR